MALIIVEKIFDGIELINKLAPEHLEIALDNAKEYIKYKSILALYFLESLLQKQLVTI